MLDKQRREGGEALISVVLFSDGCDVVRDRADISAVKEMTLADYCAGGCTALLDAIGGAIRHIGNVHKYALNEDVPERTIFVIITDGMENASRVYSAERVRAMIERQKRKYGWEFFFLGADLRAIETARRCGIGADRTAFLPRRRPRDEVQLRGYERYGLLPAERRQREEGMEGTQLKERRRIRGESKI